MDIKWCIDENICAYKEGNVTLKNACSGILNAVAMSETDTIMQYQYARDSIVSICKDIDDELGRILSDMLNNIISDEGNHDASAKKAAALCAGYKVAKPDELKEAGKINDCETV